MAAKSERWTDTRVEVLISYLLRFGVVLSSAIVLIGGIVYLFRFGAKPPQYRNFHSQSAPLQTLSGIIGQALHLHSRAVIQLGLLVLIATPIARVAFSVIAFVLERDWLYVALTLVVLGVLMYSLSAGR